jgi:DNA-binding response OmpR family regulator
MSNKLLIVDDEPHLRMLIEQAVEDLEDEGIELLFAENGEEALEKIKSEKPRLVFLDIMMPKLNGMEVCKQVKKTEELKDIHIILLTAKGQEVDRQSGLDVGADLYMTKPFDPDNLFQQAKKVFEIA